jgi:hypothetical protein
MSTDPTASSVFPDYLLLSHQERHAFDDLWRTENLSAEIVFAHCVKLDPRESKRFQRLWKDHLRRQGGPGRRGRPEVYAYRNAICAVYFYLYGLNDKQVASIIRKDCQQWKYTDRGSEFREAAAKKARQRGLRELRRLIEEGREDDAWQLLNLDKHITHGNAPNIRRWVRGLRGTTARQALRQRAELRRRDQRREREKVSEARENLRLDLLRARTFNVFRDSNTISVTSGETHR